SEFFNEQVSRIINPPDDPVLLGRQILDSGAYPCATCHVLDDLGWTGNIGPSLNLIGSQDRINRRLSATGSASMEEYLIASIRHPGDYLVPGYGNLMPQFNPEPNQPNYMPDSDLEAIVAYLLSQTGE
ncbi:cytochrome c, partial [Anaerolineae bacterium CFX9]|nr:cytochrome c [Anaerolineae bacterium CFX9]